MLTLRLATSKDCDILFDWANDDDARLNSFSSHTISYNEHCAWFSKKLSDIFSKIYIFSIENKNAGVVRIEKKDDEYVISIIVDKTFRGKKLASKMITLATNHYCSNMNCTTLYAYIKKINIASYKSFISAGYCTFEELEIASIESIKLIHTID